MKPVTLPPSPPRSDPAAQFAWIEHHMANGL
jgi:hypothetical protein